MVPTALQVCCSLQMPRWKAQLQRRQNRQRHRTSGLASRACLSILSNIFWHFPMSRYFAQLRQPCTAPHKHSVLQGVYSSSAQCLSAFSHSKLQAPETHFSAPTNTVNSQRHRREAFEEVLPVQTSADILNLSSVLQPLAAACCRRALSRAAAAGNAAAKAALPSWIGAAV